LLSLELCFGEVDSLGLREHGHQEKDCGQCEPIGIDDFHGVDCGLLGKVWENHPGGSSKAEMQRDAEEVVGYVEKKSRAGQGEAQLGEIVETGRCDIGQIPSGAGSRQGEMQLC
jgi:hypothetical protein